MRCAGDRALATHRHEGSRQTLTAAGTITAMYQPGHNKFVVADAAEMLARLCATLPATLVTTSDDGSLRTSILPMLFYPDEGDHGVLLGHLARPNGQWRDARPDAEAIAILNGPDAYVTPTWYEEK